MKKQFISLLILLITGTGLFAQNVKLSVADITALTTQDEGIFFYPKLTPDGQSVLFTGPHFQGLYVLNLSDKTITLLNRDEGAGYEYQISADGKSVFYRAATFKNHKKYYTLKEQNLSNRSSRILESEIREMTPPQIFKGRLTYLKNAEVVQRILTQNLQKKRVQNIGAVFVGDRNMLLINNGERKEMAPLGEGLYLWPHLSPDGQKIVFTFGGDATYVCDLDGNILSKIGYANAPVWSPDGKWIVYMVDHDNGDYFTDSEIFISSADGKQKIQVTDTPDIIEMYPSWGAKLNQLVFASNRGQIFMAILKTE
ncbi:hypothetical protein DRI50_00350 [candidate division KSB1 bacterium]|nr:MAG: hypothetical protein DRI50_00350 [candidate division KSB1 bacterium]